MVDVVRSTDGFGLTAAPLLAMAFIVGSSIGEDSREGTLALSVEAEGPDISAVEIGTAIVLSATRGTIVAEGAVVDSLERLVDPRTDVGGSELFLGMFRDCILVVA